MEKLICPLIYAGWASNKYASCSDSESGKSYIDKNEDYYCKYKECAWWDNDSEQCIIHSFKSSPKFPR